MLGFSEVVYLLSELNWQYIQPLVELKKAVGQ